MGDFEVTFSITVKAQDRHDAAEQVYALISKSTPTAFWVGNDGGVGDEVRVDAAPAQHHSASSAPDVTALIEDLYRLGIMQGADSDDVDSGSKAKAADVKARLIALYANLAREVAAMGANISSCCDEIVTD